MRRAFMVLAAVIPPLAASCQAPVPSSLYPSDPLLILKKPLTEARLPLAKPSATVLVAAEPLPPPVPSFAVSSAKHQILEPRVTTLPEPGPVCLVSATEYRATTDLHQLTGTLERTSEGHFELRYRRPSLDAPDDKVLLEDDPRLATLGDGAAVEIQGALVPTWPPSASVPLRRYKASTITRLSP